MKIYTGTGDQGKTSLFSGERVSKGHRRIAAYGDVDELNSVIGALAAALPADHPDLGTELQQIQTTLFDVGAWLSASPDSPSLEMLNRLTEDEIRRLEQAIDRMDAALAPLSGFILPGGHPTAAWSHVARTVCRRAERKVVALAEDAGDPAAMREILGYLNRLSDYLFVLARTCNHLAGIPDIPWKR